MKNYRAPFLFSLAFLFSPLAGCAFDQPSPPMERIVDKVTPDLARQFDLTVESIEKFSNGNEDVQAAAGSFFAALSTSYSRGEGMIELDIERILAAVRFAAEKHQLQTRKNVEATPYIIHPIRVADHLLKVGKVHDPDILIAALLHDTVEDTETTLEEIESHFGLRAASFVKEVTDDRSLSKEERKRLQVLHAPHKSAGAAQIKLGDKYDNLNNLLQDPPPDWDKERIENYFSWAAEVVNALPWVNAPLKNSIDQIISTFWQQQAKST